MERKKREEVVSMEWERQWGVVGRVAVKDGGWWRERRVVAVLCGLFCAQFARLDPLCEFATVQVMRHDLAAQCTIQLLEALRLARTCRSLRPSFLREEACVRAVVRGTLAAFERAEGGVERLVATGRSRRRLVAAA